MGASYVRFLDDLAVELDTPSLSFAAPTDNAGGISLLGWRTGSNPSGYAPDACDVYIRRSTGGPITFTAAYVLILNPATGTWHKVRDLNEGNNIVVSQFEAYSERLRDIGAATALRVVATGDVGTSVYGAVPLEVIGRR